MLIMHWAINGLHHPLRSEAKASLADIGQAAALFLHSARLFSQKNVGTHYFVFNKKIRAHEHDYLVLLTIFFHFQIQLLTK
jgi:hypothetical protein